MLELSTLSSTDKFYLASLLLLLVLLLALVAKVMSPKVESESEFLVADRQVPLLLSVLALLATWFGSSSVIESSTKMYQGGLSDVLLDPIACGATLILTGVFFAERFWNTGAATVADLFRQQFGPSSEKLSCAIQVPSFFLWIGSQFLAMGQLLQSTLEIPLWIGILISAISTLGIVLWGGMWAVTWANSIMIIVSMASVLVLFGTSSLAIGDGDAVLGVRRVIESAPEGHLQIDGSTSSKFLGILSVLLIGLFGNVPGQDIQQRVASAKSARTARWTCVLAGCLYLLFGMVPLYLGLAARWDFGGELPDSELPLSRIAEMYLSQPFQVLLIVGMFSLCLAVAAGSTLGQASIVYENLLKPRMVDRTGSVWLARLCVGIVIAGSAVVAYSGESIMQLLELSLVIVLVSLFVPMVIALFFPSERPRPALGISAMLSGFGAWLTWLALQDQTHIPASLVGLATSVLVGAMHFGAVRIRTFRS